MGQLGEMIREARRAHGWSLRQTGDAAGIHFVHVRDIESGKVAHPTKPTLEGLASALDIPLRDLILAAYGERQEAASQQEVPA